MSGDGCGLGGMAGFGVSACFLLSSGTAFCSLKSVFSGLASSSLEITLSASSRVLRNTLEINSSNTAMKELLSSSQFHSQLHTSVPAQQPPA